MSTKCPQCELDNPNDSKFCKECGTQLASPESKPDITQTLETPIQKLSRGTVFANRYEIIEELGQGGMGTVCKAIDKKLEEEVAIKLVRPEIASDTKVLQRFSNELKLARKIVHKNVCRMYELMEYEGTAFITMEYVRGETLAELESKIGKLSIDQAISIAMQVCEGLEEAHNLSIIHRDLKPSNIMIDAAGNVRIMDFGLARTVTETRLTSHGRLVGTPAFRSPEQAEDKMVDERSDIYSLGIILYEALTGKLPFDADTPIGIALKQRLEEPEDPRTLEPQIPGNLSQLILKCIAKEKAHRYQSAGELRSELMNLEEDFSSTKRKIPERTPLISKEKTALSDLKKILFPALLVFALAILVVVIWKFLPGKKEASIAFEKPSVAVLPILDLSPQKDQEYFCDGMTDEIIARLSTFKGWKVIPRTSMMRYKNTDKSIAEIGEELDVATILEGSMRKEGDNIRVNTKLIRIEDSNSLWSDTYNEKLESVFAIQSDVAERIAEALKVELSAEEKVRLDKPPTESLTAYDYYLRGREFYFNYRKDDNEQAIELFKKALESDPDFALAYAGLGDSYAQRMSKFGLPVTWLDESIEASEKAILLRPDLSEGYKALGLAYQFKRFLRKAIEAYRKAIELNPNNDVAVSNLGACHMMRGEYEKAFECYLNFFVLNPNSPMVYERMGEIHYHLGDYSKSEQYLKSAFDLQPHYYDTNNYLIRLYLSQGKNQQAVDLAEEWILSSPNNSAILSWAGLAELYAGNIDQAQHYFKKSGEIQVSTSNLLGLGYVLWKKGQQDEARKLFDQSFAMCQKQLEQGSESWYTPKYLAALMAIQGKKADAFKWLQKAIDAGWREFRFGERDPRFENIRDEEQFRQMMSFVTKDVDEMRARIEQKEKQESEEKDRAQ